MLVNQCSPHLQFVAHKIEWIERNIFGRHAHQHDTASLWCSVKTELRGHRQSCALKNSDHPGPLKKCPRLLSAICRNSIHCSSRQHSTPTRLIWLDCHHTIPLCNCHRGNQQPYSSTSNNRDGRSSLHLRTTEGVYRYCRWLNDCGILQRKTLRNRPGKLIGHCYVIGQPAPTCQTNRLFLWTDTPQPTSTQLTSATWYIRLNDYSLSHTPGLHFPAHRNNSPADLVAEYHRVGHGSLSGITMNVATT